MTSHGLFTRMRSEVVCLAPPIPTEESTLDDLVAAVRDSIVDVFGE
jgi:adenosylmethionine-8-amino-7-oxononanoate aminotransferase